jgi:hypothetical protein
MEDDTDNKLVMLPESEQHHIAMESMQLAEDRLYIILHAKDTDNVSVRMYDTTESEEVTGAHVLLYGLMHLLDNNYDEVVSYGHNSIIEKLVDFGEEEFDIKDLSDNVVHVKFSKDN